MSTFTIGPRLLDYASKKIIQFVRYTSGKVVKRTYAIGATEPESVETLTDANHLPSEGIHNQEFEMYKQHSRMNGL